MVIEFGEFGTAQLLCAGKEEADLVFDGGQEYYFSFRVSIWGDDQAAFNSTEFSKQEKSLKVAFGVSGWLEFLLTVQDVVQKNGFSVEVFDEEFSCSEAGRRHPSRFSRIRRLASWGRDHIGNAFNSLIPSIIFGLIVILLARVLQEFL